MRSDASGQRRGGGGDGDVIMAVVVDRRGKPLHLGGEREDLAERGEDVVCKGAAIEHVAI